MRLLIFATMLSGLLVACGGSGGKDPILGTPSVAIAPRVLLTTPAKLVPIVTGVAANMALAAKFTHDMTASSLNTSSFTVTCAGTPFTGTVTYDAANQLAIFQHANFTSGSTCEATITTAAKDTANVALAENYVWSFVTGAADTTPPTITAKSPANAAIGVCLSKSVSVTFSEPMNPATITAANFYVSSVATPSMPGAITYDILSNTATFDVTNPAGFVANTLYTTHVNTGVTDLAGLPLASNNTSTFTTGMQSCALAAPISLGSIASYGVFGGGAGATNSGITTVVNGDLGTTGVCTTITGFHDALNTYTEGSNLGSVRGSIYCAPPAPGTLASQAIATQAAADALIAYNALAAITPAAFAGIGSGELGGLTLPPGTYKPTPSSFELKTGNLTLDAAGDANAIWVFQVPTSITIGETAQARSVVLINGAQAKNVFWQVGSAARIENGSTMVGTIIASAGVTISTAGQTVQTTLTGRAIGLNASVTMVNTTVTVP
jgi:hypothetical protein